MLTELPKEFRKYSKHCRSLQRIIQDTQNSFEEIHNYLQSIRKYFTQIFAITL